MPRSYGTLAAFGVMVVSLIALMAFFQGDDINTEVKTAEESELPLILSAEAPSDLNLDFRYPRNWEISTNPWNNDLGQQSIAADVNTSFTDPDAPTYDITMLVQRVAEGAPNDAEAALIGYLLSLEQNNPVVPLFDATETSLEAVEETLSDEVEDTDYASEISGARIVVEFVNDEGDDVVNLVEYVRLTDELEMIVSNNAPIDEGDFADIEDDVAAMLNTLNVSDVAVPGPPQPTFTYELPNGWEITDENPTASQLTLIADQEGFEETVDPSDLTGDPELAEQGAPVVQIIMQVLPPATATQQYGSAVPSEITNTLVGDQNFTIVEEPNDITYLGLEGSNVEISFVNQGQFQQVDATFLASDEFVVQVLTFYFSEDGTELYGDSVQELLDSVEYTAPSPEIFQAPQLP